METPVSEPPRQYKLQPISVEGFEGPLDLLLSLIEGGQFDISRVSLASVTDQYLARVRSLNNVPPEHLADFLVVAATLLLLKSKRLFPDLALTEEEEEQVASLEEQLREYRRFREAAKSFVRLWNRGQSLHARAAFLGVGATFYPPPAFDRAALREAMGLVLMNLPRLDLAAQEVIRRVLSIEERIRDIQARVRAHTAVSFQDVAKSGASKLDVIVSFLALLELVKQQLVTAEQTGEFRDILLSPRSSSDESNA